MKKGCVISILIVLLSINIVLATETQFSFDSTGTTSGEIFINSMKYTVELVSATSSDATIAVISNDGIKDQQTISTGSTKALNGVQVYVKTCDSNNIKYTATILVSAKPDPNDIILDSTGTSSEEVIINSLKYTIELVSATTTTATIRVTSNDGIKDQQTISAGSTRVLNGVQVYVKTCDSNNVKYTATIQVKEYKSDKIQCYKNDDCGSSVSKYYCSKSDLCYESKIYYCMKPGTIESSCVSGGAGGCAPCKLGCSDGACIKYGKCSSDKDCPTLNCIKAPCPTYKCIEGECKITSSECTDSDGGENIYEAGEATNSNGGQGDYCDFFGSNMGTLHEAVCKDGFPSSVIINCPKETPYCNKAICSKEKPICTDSDGGLNYIEKGTVFEPRIKEGPEYTDYCENLDNYQPWDGCTGESCGLREYYCENPYSTTTYKDVKCIDGCKDGRCKGEISCQPTKCEDGSFTECNMDNNICSCSTCPPIIIKPVCGNGICESGEGEICSAPDIAMYCEKGKECSVPAAKCNVICPEDCKQTEGIYVNINEKFKLQVYQPAKILENGNTLLKVTFKNLMTNKCKETESTPVESNSISTKVALATAKVVAEIETGSSGGGSGGGSSSPSLGSSGGGSGAGSPNVTTGVGNIIRCIDSKPKALLEVESIGNNQTEKNNILNFDLGEKKQFKEFAISFLDYDYASKTGVFLVIRESFNCPVGCKCNEKGEKIECKDRDCNKGETLCPDGVCREKCEIIDPIDCKYGCLYNGKCYPMGIRDSGMYCGTSQVMEKQRSNEDKCENNFECDTNVCVSGKCISQSLINKFLNWFKNIFG